MKTKIKLLMGLLMVALTTGCQTRIEYTSPLGDKFVYVRPWLDRKAIAELTVSGDTESREFRLKGYQSRPEWEAIPAIVGSAVNAGVQAGKGVAP
jgi:hypothetical protein